MGKRGVALITTLMVIALLVAVVVQFNRTAIGDIDISRNFVDGKRMLYVAISGVNAVKDLLTLDAAYTKSDNLQEPWANSTSYFDAASAVLEGGDIEGTITDEQGKISVNALVDGEGNFNEVQKDLWERLLIQPVFALTEDRVAAIVSGVKDWIDRDSEITGIFGAEDAFYTSKGYRCPNRAVQHIEEMLLINGMTPEVFYGTENRLGIRPFFTVYGGGTININTAPIPVLLALSPRMNETLARELDAFRRDEANRVFLADKQWYKKIWPYEEGLLDALLTTESGHFEIRIRSTMGENKKEITAFVGRSEEGADILFWRET